ncbi:VRR-NUC domain-containing protein [Corallococcus sp. CA047B]|uniref:VRR-NUC domain-containing protein n=1 Tax=Corallococcus sp. CA047B TaxID=2316729 RepID=UPI000EA22DB5|nr:VRR-NUC domain-containing protein [Corallococcus sp. CA047B]RKH08717.1 VRR-NUC domain-containing protein [Corallococcus sp. CA047B]
MRWAAQRDDAEPAVAQALQLAGWTVERVSAPGFPDLLCCRRGQVVLLEVKSKGGRMKPAQVELHARLRAAGVIVAIVTTPEEALAAVRGEVTRTALDVRAEKRGRSPRARATSAVKPGQAEGVVRPAR